MACGGSAVPRSLMTAYDELGIRIVQVWGMTETSPLAAVALPRDTDSAEKSLQIRATQGRVVAGVQADRLATLECRATWDGKIGGEYRSAALDHWVVLTPVSGVVGRVVVHRRRRRSALTHSSP